MIHACTHDWPASGSKVDLVVLHRVLAEFDQHHPGAVRSLAETDASEPDRDDAADQKITATGSQPGATRPSSSEVGAK